MYPIYSCMVIVRLLVGGAGRVGAAIRQAYNMMHMCAVYAVADKHINIMWTTWPNALPLRRKGIGRSTTLCFGPRIAQLLVRCALCRKVCYVLLYVCIFRVGSRAEVIHTTSRSVLMYKPDSFNMSQEMKQHSVLTYVKPNNVDVDWDTKQRQFQELVNYYSQDLRGDPPAETPSVEAEWDSHSRQLRLRARLPPPTSVPMVVHMSVHVEDLKLSLIHI